MADTSEPVLQPGRRRWRRVLVWVTSILFLLFATAFTIISIYFHRAGPILRARVVETLSTRFDSRVELASFKVSVFRGFEVNGGGLKLYPNHISTKEPCFSVDKFSFRTGWRDLFAPLCMSAGSIFRAWSLICRPKRNAAIYRNSSIESHFRPARVISCLRRCRWAGSSCCVPGSTCPQSTSRAKARAELRFWSTSCRSTKPGS